MKRLLAILLLMIMCISAFSACNNEADSSTEMSEESASEKEEQHYPYVDDDGFPVFRNSQSTYEYINVQAREDLSYHVFDTIPIGSYDEMRTFMLQNLNQSSINGIDETFFETNFLIAVYRDNNRKMKEHYSYSALTSHKTLNYHYTLNFEYVTYTDKGYTMEIQPNTFDLVIVSKTESSIQSNIHKLIIDIRETEHTYSLSISLSNPDITEYDITLPSKLVVTQNDYNIICSSIESPYKHYTIEIKNYQDSENLNNLDGKIINTYSEFIDTLSGLSDEPSQQDINEETFSSYIAFAITATSYYKHYESFGNLKRADDYYIMDFEYMSYLGRDYTEQEEPITIDFILIPKSEFQQELENITIYLRSIEHTYSCETEFSIEPF